MPFWSIQHRLFKCVSLLLTIFIVSCGSVAPREDSFTIKTDQVYVTRDTKPLFADVYLPPGSGPFPGIVLIHGGGWYKRSKEDMSNVAETLVEEGYTVVNISYRFAPTYIFPAQVHDCKEAVRWMRRNAKTLKLDPSRIGAFGYSAGAHLAMMLAVTSPTDGLEGPSVGKATDTRIQVVVAGGTPSDMLAFPENETVQNFLGGPKAKIPEVYRAASPINFVTEDDPPTFLYHGKFDWIVDVEQSRALAHVLQKAKVPVEYYEATLGHIATFLFDEDELMRSIHFLNRWLKPS